VVAPRSVTVRRRVFFAIALALLGLTGILLQLDRPTPDVADGRRLETFPTVLDGWTDTRPAVDDLLPPDLPARQRLVRAFKREATTLSVYVGYYDRQPPPSELVLPPRGWAALERRVVVIPLDERAGHSLSVNLEVLQTEGRRTTILYWYQVGTRPIAGAHWYRAVLLWNRLVHGRAESALVRIGCALDRSADPATVLATQGEFVRLFYPELIKALAW
jgi:EpsI family protein